MEEGVFVGCDRIYVLYVLRIEAVLIGLLDVNLLRLLRLSQQLATSPPLILLLLLCRLLSLFFHHFLVLLRLSRSVL